MKTKLFVFLAGVAVGFSCCFVDAVRYVYEYRIRPADIADSYVLRRDRLTGIICVRMWKLNRWISLDEIAAAWQASESARK